MTQSNQPAAFEADSWFPHNRPTLHLHEVAEAFAISIHHVRDLVDEGVLVAAGVHGLAAPSRVHLRIERWSVIAWRLNLLAEQGQPLPFKESPQVTWWRAELLKRPILPACVPGRTRSAATGTPAVKSTCKPKRTTASKKNPRPIAPAEV